MMNDEETKRIEAAIHEAEKEKLKAQNEKLKAQNEKITNKSEAHPIEKELSEGRITPKEIQERIEEAFKFGL